MRILHFSQLPDEVRETLGLSPNATATECARAAADADENDSARNEYHDAYAEYLEASTD